MSSILQATEPARGASDSAPAIRSSQSGSSSTSVFTSATASAAAASIPRFAAKAKPVLRPSSITRTSGC